MGFTKKTAKGRLDKYYFLAKDQGYRARSAFKLVQLNKKYNFLDQAKVTIDLCAAPGGWLQVAAKYMPSSNIIIGVDLVPIKPIPGVTTLVDDITSEKCRSDLKREMKGWKADVVLHDGAPNVGRSWEHDAYSQSELVLHSLKLATEFLVKDGTFVTKVFRSKDYNSLLWVFNQLFTKVEATKPASSRDVSAEIFVVCRGFKAPDYIDPSFTDPKKVFEELGSLQKNAASSADSQKINLEHPEKKPRHRSGYEDGVTMLFKQIPVQEYIFSNEPNNLLATCNRLIFDADTDERIVALADDPKIKDSIRTLCEDLKVLGYREFKILTKWRFSVRAAFGLDADATSKAKSTNSATECTEITPIADEEISGEKSAVEELDEMTKKLLRSEKRSKTKALERMAKQKLRLQKELGNHASDLANDMATSESLFSLTNRSLRADGDSDWEFSEDQEQNSDDLSQSGDVTGNSSESENDNLERWEEEMEAYYQMKKGHSMRRDAMEMAYAERRKLTEAVDSDLSDAETTVATGEKKSSKHRNSSASVDDGNCDSEVDPDTTGLTTSLLNKDQQEEEVNVKMEMWYSNPLFQDFQESAENSSNSPIHAQGKRAFEDLNELSVETSTKKLAKLKKMERARKLEESKSRKKSKSKDEDAAADAKPGQIEFVKADEYPSDLEESEDDEFDADAEKLKKAAAAENEALKKNILTPHGMTMAARLAKDRENAADDLVDESFNRHTFADTAHLPRWFVENDSAHRRPDKPITKEGVALLKAKQRELDARPIKKVLEAKGRNRKRVQKKIDALKQKAAVIADSEDMGERQKSVQIQKMLAKGSKSQKRETKLIVARGNTRGVKGRPRGVKGHYKMVDNRLKKDMRAKARAAKRNGRK